MSNKQIIEDAITDAGTVSKVTEGPEDTQVTSRTGRKIWTLSTLGKMIQIAKDKIVELNDAIEIAAAAGAGANGWTDLLIQTWSGRTQESKNKDVVNLRDFCKLDDTDETGGFLRAIDEARNSSRRLVAESGTIRISKDVNMRQLDIDLSGLTIKTVGESKVHVGWSSGNVYAKKQRLGSVFNNSGFKLDPSLLDHATVRFWGSKCETLIFNQIDYMELYVSTDPLTYPNDASISYCSFYGDLLVKHTYKPDPRFEDEPFGGAGSSSQWINSNMFFVTRMMGVDINGAYQHNGNIYHNPIFENPSSYIKILNGAKNLFLNIRGENNPAVYFGEKSEGNIVERCWYSSSSLFNIFQNFTDLGRQNKYTSKQIESSKTYNVVQIGIDSFKQKNGYIPDYQYQQCTKRAIRGDGAARLIYQTNIFDIDSRDLLFFNCDSVDGTVSRYNVRIYIYDENGSLIKNGDDSWRSGANFNSSNISDGYFSGIINSSGQTWFNFIGAGLDRVKKVSISILNANTHSQSNSRNLSVTLSTMRSGFEPRATRIKESSNYGFSSSKPTKFIGDMGDKVTMLNGDDLKCTFYLDSSLTKIHQQSSKNIEISRIDVLGVGSVEAGDFIGIDLDNGYTHWSIIDNISSNDVEISSPIPFQASQGSLVYISRLA